MGDAAAGLASSVAPTDSRSPVNKLHSYCNYCNYMATFLECHRTKHRMLSHLCPFHMVVPGRLTPPSVGPAPMLLCVCGRT